MLSNNESKSFTVLSINKGVKPRSEIDLQQLSAVITILPNHKIVDNFYFGEKGIANKLAKGTLLIDCSTIGPTAALDLHKKADTFGLNFADAPVSGGVKGATDGTLAFMIGCKNNEIYDVF